MGCRASINVISVIIQNHYQTLNLILTVLPGSAILPRYDWNVMDLKSSRLFPCLVFNPQPRGPGFPFLHRSEERKGELKGVLACLTSREEANCEGRPLSTPLQCQQRKTRGNGEEKGKGGGERAWSENDGACTHEQTKEMES